MFVATTEECGIDVTLSCRAVGSSPPESLRNNTATYKPGTGPIRDRKPAKSRLDWALVHTATPSDTESRNRAERSDSHPFIIQQESSRLGSTWPALMACLHGLLAWPASSLMTPMNSSASVHRDLISAAQPELHQDVPVSVVNSKRCSPVPATGAS